MKRYFIAALGLVVPGLLFVNAWQGYRYSELENTVSALEKQQQDLLEANRDVIAEIAYERSAARVEQKATRSFALAPADPARVLRFVIQTDANGGPAR